MNFNYYIPTKILFGCGKLGELHKEVMPGKKALIVISAGKSTKANGYLARTEEQLKLAGVESVVFDEIQPNPTLVSIMDGAAKAKENGCDFIVGLGGGSSIDASKAIAIMSNNPGNYWDYITAGSGKKMPIPNHPLPIIAITTTAGTGTEADPWAVVTKEDTKEKIGFGYDETFPVISVVDPELMTTVPPFLTACQGFDALFHSTEGYLNNATYPISDAFSIKAIELVSKSLAAAVADGNNIEARADVALANTISGMVESTSGCTSEHSIEHAMSAFHTKLTHGAGLIMICEAYYKLHASKGINESRLVDMAKAMGKKDATSSQEFIDALVELKEACGVVDLKMSEVGITPEEFEDIAINARHTMPGLFAADTIEISKEEVIQILADSYK